MRVINKFPDPPNKDVGEGLNTAFEAMKNLRLKAPVFVEPENAVIVQIKHERLASAEDIVMEYIENNPVITNRVARKLTGIKSENSMKLVFLRLRDRRLLEPVPGRSGFASAWQKAKRKPVAAATAHGRKNDEPPTTISKRSQNLVDQMLAVPHSVIQERAEQHRKQADKNSRKRGAFKRPSRVRTDRLPSHPWRPETLS